MADYVHYVNVLDNGAEQAKDTAALNVLPGEIAGTETFVHRLAAKRSTTLPALQDRHRILFLVEGSGSVSSGDAKHSFSGLSVFISSYQSAVSIESESEVVLLELTWRMVDTDADVLASGAAQLPYFLPYASAKTYNEAIKSPKTTSRTLVPTGIVPRFAAGSVQTTGPDAVGEHAHPMLEQFFLGLPGNDCTVSADGHKAPLGSWTLLHIPLGSMHGVSVNEGKELHYIWIDMFSDKKGEEWISTMHKEDE